MIRKRVLLVVAIGIVCVVGYLVYREGQPPSLCDTIRR